VKRDEDLNVGRGSVTYEEWEQHVPACIREDTLWRMEAYRLGLFPADLAWHDATKLGQDHRTRSLSDQLYRAVGNVSSNVGEGYSRGTGKDRARFYEYTLGSTRESRDWYHKGRHVLGGKVAEHRMELCTQIIRLTITMVARERRTNRKVVDRE
jgi:four helix bundle protein